MDDVDIQWPAGPGFTVDNPGPDGPPPHQIWVQSQDILNERPVPDPALQHAWPSPPRVTARMEWEQDGEEFRETSATRWAEVDGETVIAVVFADNRHRGVEVWLGLDDVTPSDQR
jgi:hypothetical protein